MKQPAKAAAAILAVSLMLTLSTPAAGQELAAGPAQDRFNSVDRAAAKAYAEDAAGVAGAFVLGGVGMLGGSGLAMITGTFGAVVGHGIVRHWNNLLDQKLDKQKR